MSAFIKFRPSGSQDVVSYLLYHRPDEPNVPLTKDNSNLAIDLGNPAVNTDGFIVVELNAIPELTGLEGTYDLGVAAVDGAGNISPLLTTGLIDISLDFLAPSPPSEASVYWS
jgi:hypothetical protein